jgi:hypothetical protein
MKPFYSQHISNVPRANEAGRDVGHVSLQRLKAEALSASASHVNQPSREVAQAFGFFPKDIQGVVVRWPSL